MDPKAEHNGEPEVIPPLNSKTVKTVLNIFLLKCFSLLLINLLYLVIERLYGTEAVGAFGLYFSVITIGSLLASFGFGNAALKISGSVGKEAELNIVSHAYRIMLRLTSVAAAFLAIIVLVSGKQLAEIFLDDPSMAPVFYCCALALIPMSLLEITSEIIRGRGKTNLYMIFKETGLWVVAAPVMLFLIFAHYGYLSPIIAHTVAILVFCVIGIFVVQELLRTTSDQHVSKYTMKSLLQLSLPMQMSKGLNWASLWIDILIISGFIGVEKVGIYLVLNRVAAFVQQVSYSINVYVAPRIAYHHQQQRIRHLRKLTQDSVKYGVWIITPLVIGLMIFSEPILGLWKESYTTEWLAFSVLLLAFLVDTACGPVGYLLNMTGKEQSSVHIMVTTTVVRVIFLLVLVGYMEMGLLGAALAHLGFVLVWNVVSLVVIEKHLGFYPAYIPFWNTRARDE